MKSPGIGKAARVLLIVSLFALWQITNAGVTHRNGEKDESITPDEAKSNPKKSGGGKCLILNNGSITLPLLQ